MKATSVWSPGRLAVLLLLAMSQAGQSAWGKDGFVRGPVEVPVSIVVYADFSCVYCARSNAILNDIAKIYPDKVVIIFKDLPLRRDNDGMLAHEAAHEAGHQGKFWPMHDWLLENQGKFNSADITKQAGKLGLDMQKFNQAIDQHVYQKDILASVAEARAHRVKATPTYFIDGYKLEGMQSLSTFQQIIEHRIQPRAGETRQ